MPRTPSLPKYSPLPSNEDDADASTVTPRQSLRTSVRRIASGTVTSALMYLAVLGLLLSLTLLVEIILPQIRAGSLTCATVHGEQESAPVQKGYKAGRNAPCGSSWQEAEAAGCVFDLMTASWLPHECYDGELTAEFLEAGPYPFFFSNSTLPEAPVEDRIEIASIEAIGRSTENMWTNRQYHFYHCIFGWKMMHRAVERGWKMESSLATYHHTEHCAATLSNITVPFERVITRVEVSFPSC